MSDSDFSYNEYFASLEAKKTPAKSKSELSLHSRAMKAFENTHENEDVCGFFSTQGINSESINKFKLGSWDYDGHKRFMVPVFNQKNKVAYLKLRRTPSDESADTIAEQLGKDNPNPEYVVYPDGANLILVGEDQLYKSTSNDVLICDNELERILAIQEGVKMPVVTGGNGTHDFKDKWINMLKNMRNVYLCLNDVEDDEFEEFAKHLSERLPKASVFKVSLPANDSVKTSLKEYFTRKHGTADELFSKYSEYYCGSEPIDPSKFEEMYVNDIAEVLDTTIKYDYVTKCIIFLAMLLAYTESDQLNIMINGDSSSGKSYNVSEVSKLFPEQDVLMYGKTTPTAFYYSSKLRKIDDKTGQAYMDLERRIMVFVEQPDTKLQENLRALLSHDKKKIPFAITNKGKKGENTAIEGYMLGFPSTFFCSANMKIDEQEQTRCLILSPETSREKVFAGMHICLTKGSNKNAYDAKIRSNGLRNQLIERILYIKSLNVDSINIDEEDSNYLMTKFLMTHKHLRAKDQRGMAHFISLVKAMALLNAPFRTVDGQIVATKKDVDEVLKLWIPLCESEIHGVSPQVYDFYKKYILGAYYKKNADSSTKRGITFKELSKEYFVQNGSYPNMENVRKQYIPALETASLITVAYDKEDDGDGRQKLITPNFFPNDSKVEEKED